MEKNSGGVHDMEEKTVAEENYVKNEVMESSDTSSTSESEEDEAWNQEILKHLGIKSVENNVPSAGADSGVAAGSSDYPAAATECDKTETARKEDEKPEQGLLEEEKIKESEQENAEGKKITLVKKTDKAEETSTSTTFYSCDDWAGTVPDLNESVEEEVNEEDQRRSDLQLAAHLGITKGPREEGISEVKSCFPKDIPLKPNESWDYSLSGGNPDVQKKALLVEGSHYKELVEQCLHEMQNLTCQCSKKEKITVCRLCHVVFCSNKCFKTSIKLLTGEEVEEESSEDANNTVPEKTQPLPQPNKVHGAQHVRKQVPAFIPRQVELQQENRPHIPTNQIWREMPEPRSQNMALQKRTARGVVRDASSQQGFRSPASGGSRDDEQEPKSFFNKRTQHHQPQTSSSSLTSSSSSGAGRGSGFGRGSRKPFASLDHHSSGYQQKQLPTFNQSSTSNGMKSVDRSSRDNQYDTAKVISGNPSHSQKADYLGFGRGNVGRGQSTDPIGAGSPACSYAVKNSTSVGPAQYSRPVSFIQDAGNIRTVPVPTNPPGMKESVVRETTYLTTNLGLPHRVTFPVVYVNGTGFEDFGVMMTNRTEEFRKFFAAMQNIQTKIHMSVCEPKNLCMLNYKKNDPGSHKRWYRGIITKDVVTKIGVLLIDLGVHIIVNKPEVFELPPEFAQEKPFGIRIKCLNVVADKDVDNEEIMEQFNSLVKGPAAKLKVKLTHKVAHEEGLIGCRLEVWHPNNHKWFDAGALLKTLLIGDKASPEFILSEEAKGTLIPFQSCSPQPVVKTLKPNQSEILVRILSIVGVDEFYVRTRESFESMVAIEGHLYKMTLSLTPIQNLPDYSLSLHMWKARADERYRVQIVEILDNWLDAVCYLVDYGRYETVPIKYLRILPTEFMKIQPHALKCAMPLKPNLMHKKDKEKIFAGVSDFLHEIHNANQEFAMKVYKVLDETHIVDILHDSKSLITAFVGRKMAVMSHNDLEIGGGAVSPSIA